MFFSRLKYCFQNKNQQKMKIISKKLLFGKEILVFLPKNNSQMKQIIIVAIFLGLLSCKNSTQTPSNTEFPTLSVEQLRDSLQKLQDERFDFLYFDLKNNEDAQYFFERNEISNPEDFIITQLMATNITKDTHHPLIDYRPRKGDKFQINKIKMLNHRWLICDFSDGLDWGELLIRYDLEDDKTLSFRVFDQILYPSDQKVYSE